MPHALHPILIFCTDKEVVRDSCTTTSSSKRLSGLFASDSQNYILFLKEEDCCNITATGSVLFACSSLELGKKTTWLV